MLIIPNTGLLKLFCNSFLKLTRMFRFLVPVNCHQFFSTECAKTLSILFPDLRGFQ